MSFGKVWGTTAPVFSKNGVSIHRIEIKKGGYSSEHLHEHRWNAFYCESGRVEIHTHRRETDLRDVTVLYPGDQTTVAPGDMHYFKAMEKSVVYEIYYAECDDRDIKRPISEGNRSKGGIDPGVL